MLRTFLSVVAALALSACAADAEEGPAPPPALELTGRVVDAAGILSTDFERELTGRLAKLEDETQVQLVVATTPDLADRAIADYSLDLARAWGIGHADRSDGLLLLVAPAERKVRIEVGRGLEASVKDEVTAQILRDDVLPQFGTGDFESGIRVGVDALAGEVTPSNLKEAA